MALYYALGTVLVESDELKEKAVTRQLDDLAGGELESLSFRSGSIAAADAPKSLAPSRLDTEGALIPFVDVGIGLPMTIRIHEAYPGKLPPKGVFGKRGALVSSAVKGWHVFDAKPRALNFLKKTATRGQALELPSAVEHGTTLVFYSAAVPDRALTSTFEMAFDDVDPALFDTVGDIFAAAAGLPIFLSAAPYLLAASSLFKLGGQLGNRLFDSRAEFSATEPINLGLPGDPVARAGFVLVTQSAMDEATLAGLQIPETGKLIVKETGDPYAGDIPYLVISLDGTPDSTLATFGATAVSAALLERFYNIREGGSGDAAMMIEALTLYNDLRNRTEAEKLKQQLADMPAGSAERVAVQKRFDALVKNIQNPELKPRT